MHFHKILVTGCGGDIGLGIGRILKQEHVAEAVIGCDIHERHAGRLFLDACYILPSASSPDYKEKLFGIADRLGIDVIIPTAEAELRLIEKENFWGHPEKFLTANIEAMRVGFDKYKTAECLEKNGLPFPWTVWAKKRNPLEFPCILKSSRSCGSKSIKLITSLEDLKNVQINDEDIFQEYLPDGEQEYTCSIFRARGLQRSIVFRRALRNGYTIWGEVVKNGVIADLLGAVASALGLHGSINIQLRLKNGMPIIFEINPRFSSTVVFRHKLGFTDLIWSLEDYVGGAVSSYLPPVVGTEFYKIFEDVIAESPSMSFGYDLMSGGGTLLTDVHACLYGVSREAA